MKEKRIVCEQRTIWLPVEGGHCFEEKPVGPQPGRARAIGGAMLTCLRHPRLYEYSDAISTLVLAIDHHLR